MFVEVLITTLALTFVWVHRCECGPRDWTRAIDLANALQLYQDQLTPEYIFDNLAQMKGSLILSAFLEVPRSIQEPDRKHLISSICLAKLIDISHEKCTAQGVSEIKHGNDQRGNYFEVYSNAIENFKSDNMQKFINSYFAGQLMICRNGLIPHTRSRWKKINDRWHDEPEKFKNLLIKTFPDVKSIAELTRFEKVDGLFRLMKKHFRKSAKTTRMNINAANFPRQLRFTFLEECLTNLLDPLKTVMMTYDHLGRKMTRFATEFAQTIRAYDICQDLSTMVSEDSTIMDTIAVELRQYVRQSSTRLESSSSDSDAELKQVEPSGQVTLGRSGHLVYSKNRKFDQKTGTGLQLDEPLNIIESSLKLGPNLVTDYDLASTTTPIPAGQHRANSGEDSEKTISV